MTKGIKGIKNRDFVPKLLELVGVERDESKGVTQIYVNGNPIIDDWHDLTKVAIEYYAEVDKDDR